MRTMLKRALWGTLIAGGITLLGATVANAAETTGDDGLLSGTQIVAAAQAPLTVIGNAVSAIGDGSVGTVDAAAPAAPAAPAPSDGAVTTGDDSIGGGTQVVPDITAPVTVTGNAITLLGDSAVAEAPAPAAPAPAAAAESPTATTTGADSVLGGTQVLPTVTAPIQVTGNSITLIGDSSSTGAGATPTTDTAPAAGTTGETSGSDGILGGTQVLADVLAPVSVTGNSITLIGDSSSTGTGTTPTTGTAPAAGTTGQTSGSDGILGGTQVLADAVAPIAVTGNAITLVGDPATTGGGSTAPTSGGTTGAVTDGTGSVGGGSQLVAGIALPITIGGNGITLVGDPTVGTPGDPGTPGTAGTSATALPVSAPTAATAAARVTQLAATGGTSGLAAWLMGLVLIAGGFGALLVRRRSA